MTVFTGKDQVVMFGATSLPNITSVEYPTLAADAYTVDIAGPIWKATVTGMQQATVKVNMLLNKDEATTLGTTLALGNAQTWAHYPAGNSPGNLKYYATNGVVISAPPSVPSNGLAAVTVDINLDNYTVSLVS